MKEDLINLKAHSNQRLCIRCRSPFEGRPNKRFCSSNCRKRYSEPVRNSKLSPAKYRENAEFFDRAFRLAEIVYTSPIDQRLGIVKEFIDRARYGDDKCLRGILSNWYLLNASPFKEPHLFYLRSRAHLTIAQIARNYCKRFWHANIKDVVYGKTPEPKDGVILEDGIMTESVLPYIKKTQDN